MQLDTFTSAYFDRGASRFKEGMWLIASGLLVSSWIPGSAWRVALLRVFGAQIGSNCIIKPRVQVKFPWRLRIGDHCWIGERVWIDNLAEVWLGDHVCLSQGAYLCTGSHDWNRNSFDLITAPIRIESQTWVCAKAVLAPGAHLETGAVLGLAAVGQGRLPAWAIHAGNPSSIQRGRKRPS